MGGGIGWPAGAGGGSGSGGGTFTIVSTSINATLTGWTQLVLVDASGGNRTIILATAVGNSGATVVVKKIDSSANTVTIDGSGAETIDGNATYVLYNQNESATLVSDGTNVRLV